jgi:3-hydroxyisobutyrate dehydrogenase
MLRERIRGRLQAGNLLHKDLKIVRALAIAAGVNHDIVDLSLADYAALMAEGRSDEDTSALIRLKRPRR